MGHGSSRRQPVGTLVAMDRAAREPDDEVVTLERYLPVKAMPGVTLLAEARPRG